MKTKRRICAWVLVLTMMISMLGNTSIAFAAPINKDLDAYWKSFRNNENNMAVVDVKTPKNTKTTELKWAKKLGSGWANSPCVQIIVDKKVITIAGNKIYKLNPDSGEVEQEGTLVGSTNFGYTPPTYAEGVIYCPLQNGTVQAVNAQTLESLWVYQDELKGQSLSMITYKDGYVYTGFWNSETKDANFVCLSTTDEEPDNTTEAKKPTWTYTQKGGFYWAGSIAIGNVVVVGTDDGESGNLGTSHLLSFDAKTGKVISDLKLKGDQRSCIAYDTETKRLFGTTKAGYLFSADIDQTTGELSDLKTKWYGNSGDSETATMSTSTPVVYKGVAYIGYTSSGNFGGKGYCLIAADANTLEENYRVPLIGYPQGSALLSTAYEKEDGNVYIYMTYNAQPGGITLIKAKPDAKSASDVTVEEIYDAKGYEQYCITSLICDEEGTIYYKNDSGNILAVRTNEAIIDNISITGGDPKFSETFASNVKDYDVAVNSGTKLITLNIEREDNQTVTVNDALLTGNTVDVKLVDGKATVKVKATCGSDSRTYTFSIREKSSDVSLSELKINESNSYGSFKSIESQKNYYCSSGLSESRSFTNIWTDSSDKNATVKVYAVNGVNKDADTEIKVTATNNSHKRYAIYWGDTSNKAAVVRIEVTAEDKDTVKNYYVLLTSNNTVNLYSTDGYYKYDKEQMEKAQDDFYTYLKCKDISSAELLQQIRIFNTKTDSIKAFQSQKEQALKDLTPADGVYRAEEQKEVDIILKDVKRQLQTISDEEDLETVVSRAKLDISRIKTDAQLTQEESKQTLTISKKSITLINDQTYQLSAKATSNDSSLKCEWTSSDENIATVDETGKVTAVNGGVAIITVTYGELEEVCVVSVKQEATPKRITVTSEEGKLCEGKTNVQNDYTHFYIANSGKEDSVQFSATNEDNKATTVTWSSSDGKVKISKDGKATIPANVSSSIYTKITATSIHDKAVKTEYAVYVLPKLEIESRYQSLTLALPENGIAEKNAKYVCVTPQTYDNYGLITWSIEDESIATIDGTGKNVCYVYPKKAGTTTVTATDKFHPENKATATITVTGMTVVDANENSGEGFANVGDTVQLTAKTEDEITWTTSDEKIASVDNGTVKALAKGEAVITATTENAKCSYTLTVGEAGKVYLDLLYTPSYSSLYTDEECTKALDTKSIYTKPSATWTSAVHVFPVTATNDVTLYAKAGNNNLNATFGTNFDTKKVKAQLIQNEQVSDLTSETTKNVVIKAGTNQFTIRVISLTDEKNFTDYNFTVIRAESSTATLKSAAVKPYERQLNTVKKYYSTLVKRSLTEGTLFQADENGVAINKTGFNANCKNYRAYLYSDVKEAGLVFTTTDSSTGHVAYSTDDGKNFTEGTGTLTTSGIAFDKDVAKIIVKTVSDKEYNVAKKANTDPFANANIYTFWVERMSADFDSKTTIESLSFDKNCNECSPNYVKGAAMAAALVAHDSDTATITFTAAEGVNIYKTSMSDANKLTAKSVENGMATYELEVETPLKDQGNQITQKIVLSYADEEGNRIDQDYTVYLFKVGTTYGVLKGTPDKIVDYMCLASQYTSGGNTGWGIYGVFPEKINMGAGNWYTCISLGNFGGYMTFYYDKPITDDENNPYGVDFTVFGNSNGGASFTEPGNVLVSEDGKKWYTLAGSEHYDENTRWNYEVTYSNNAGLADYKDNDGNSGEVTKNNAFGAMKYPTKNCYPLFDWKDGNEKEITVSGTRLYGSNGKKGDGVEFSGNGAMAAFGYVDVHKNSSTVAGTGEDVNLLTTPVGNPYMEDYDGYGDGFDLKWAVDDNGNPVDVSNMKFHYVKVQTASFINGGAIGEKSTEVSAMVRTSPEKESVGNTKAPKSITVDGKALVLSEGKNVYYASVKDDSNYLVEVTPASDDANVYINNERTLTRSYDALPDKGIVRIIVQDGKKNPVIYYIHVVKSGEISADNVIASLDTLGEVTLDKKDEIEAIRKMYDALSKEDQKKVENLDVLTKAENQITILEVEDKIANANDEKSYEEAKAFYDALTDEQKAQLKEAGAFEVAYVSNKIEQIGEVTLESKAIVEDARKAYDALAKNDKKKVSNYQILVNAELVLENLSIKKDFADKDKQNKDELEKVRFATADITLSKASYTYNGNERKPSVVVTVEDKTLKKNVDYVVTYKDNKNAGVASVIITGKGNYEGAKILTKNFVINAKKISTYELSKTSYTYNGKAKTPKVVVKSADKVLKKNIDYTISYKNNTKVGRASVVIKGKGNYGGTKTLNFKINPKSTSLKALKAGKKQMTVTWKKSSIKVTGYQVMYATNKNFTKGKKQITVAGTSKITATIKKLSAKKRYYAKVRTYQTVDGKNYYSSWSKVKSVKTK